LTDQSLKSLNFEKYSQLLVKLLPQATGWVAVDSSGALVWHSQGLAADTVTCIQMQLRQQGCINKIQGKLASSDNIPGTSDVHFRVLRNDTDEVLGLLVLMVGLTHHESSSLGQVKSLEQILETLTTITHLIEEEFKLCEELDSMALELGERYEELNLVYGASDLVSNYAESQEQIQKQVNHLSEHLCAEFAAIVLPDVNKTYVAHNDEFSKNEVKYLIDMTKSQLVPRMAERSKTLVVNDFASKAGDEGFLGIFYKMICYPVRGVNNNVKGVLVCFRQHDQANFSNSDRSLVEVIGHKVSKIMLATYDKLTGMLNRSSFEYIITHNVSSMVLLRSPHTLVLIKINMLHMINEMHGIEAGNEVIVNVAKLLQRVIREDDIISRYDGDRFGLVLSSCATESALKIADKIHSEMSDAKLYSAQKNTPVSLSIGLTSMESGRDSSEVLMNAELALDLARKKGRAAVEVFDIDSNETRSSQHQSRMVYHIQKALSEGHFQLYCQGIYPVGKTVPHHYEILLRLKGEDGSMIPPNDFIPAAEQYKLMPLIDRWVLKTLLETLDKNWSEIGELPISWAVNLSGQSFTDDQFEQFVRDSLNSSSVPQIGFEITETAAIDRISAAKHFIKVIKEFGCQFYLDDFGAGLSSFSYLKNLDLDYIKIDGAFIKEVIEDSFCEATVVAICHVAKVLGIKTVGEFVESVAINEKLAELGVDYGQGYALHKPAPLQEVISQLNERCNDKLLITQNR